MLMGAGLALSVGVFLGRVTSRASRSWQDWQGARAAVPPARKLAYANVRKAAFDWLLVVLIAIVVIATIAVATSDN